MAVLDLNLVAAKLISDPSVTLLNERNYKF